MWPILILELSMLNLHPHLNRPERRIYFHAERMQYYLDPKRQVIQTSVEMGGLLGRYREPAVWREVKAIVVLRSQP